VIAVQKNITNQVAVKGEVDSESIAPAQPRRFMPAVRRGVVGFIRGIGDLDARQRRKIIIMVVGVVAITIVFTYLSRIILARVNLPIDKYSTLGYLTVFLVFFVANLLLFTPLPTAMTILLTSALIWNPGLIGLSAALGASIGELSGYFAGRLGRNIFIRENFMCSLNKRFCNSRLSIDVERYGLLTIGILAAQPVLPFDIGGIIAGSIKMNVGKFFSAMLIGKSLKYVTIAYLAGAFSYIPFLK
jgi:membrane protein YqaA with SNARE-associated domain